MSKRDAIVMRIGFLLTWIIMLTLTHSIRTTTINTEKTTISIEKMLKAGTDSCTTTK